MMTHPPVSCPLPSWYRMERDKERKGGEEKKKVTMTSLIVEKPNLEERASEWSSQSVNRALFTLAIVPPVARVFRTHRDTPSFSRSARYELVQSSVPLCAMIRRACALRIVIASSLYPHLSSMLAFLPFSDNGNLLRRLATAEVAFARCERATRRVNSSLLLPIRIPANVPLNIPTYLESGVNAEVHRVHTLQTDGWVCMPHYNILPRNQMHFRYIHKYLCR